MNIRKESSRTPGLVFPMESEKQLRPRDDTAPCIGCGLCCDGTIFNKAIVTPGEETRLLAHGMELATKDDQTFFKLPCHYASCGQCTNYQDRFDICRSFRCELLKRYQAGDIDLVEARATVEKALEMVSVVKADDERAALYRERRALRGQLAERMRSGSTEERRGLARRLLNLVALDEFLDRRFRRKKKAPDESDDSTQSNSD
jgi:hypothetical protein